MSRSHVPKRATGLPPLLVNVIESAVHAERHDPDNDRAGEAGALTACGQLAARIVPARGVLAPASDDLYREIGIIAARHLGFGEVRKTFRNALERVQTFEDRDAVESAYTHVITVSDAAYYYTGLEFGLTLAYLGKRW